MNSKLKTLQIIHLALCSGIFLFSLVTIFLNRERIFFDANPANTAPFNPIFPIVGLITITGSLFFFRNLMAKIDFTAPLETKFNLYQSAFIISSALLEGGALFNTIGFFIAQNAYFLIFAGANFILLVLRRPTKDKLISTLQLQYPDTEAL